MAYNFLGLVNQLCSRLNEVRLTAGNFASATGWHEDAKNAVNNALNNIYSEDVKWPFTHITQTDTLIINQVRYTFPANAKSVNFDSFRIKGDDTKNVSTINLRQMDYEEYLNKYSDADFNGSKYAHIPHFVFRTPNEQFGVYPPPDKTYELVYEYHSVPDALESWDDVPAFPAQFDNTIVDGAVYYAYVFRSDPEAAMLAKKDFTDGIADMRKWYENRYEYMRSGMITK